MSKLHLKIVTPEKEIYNDEVDMVTATTADGEIGILPHHANLMSKILPGELKIVNNNKESSLATGYGLLQITNNVLQITTDLAEKVEEIDEKLAEEARKRAQDALEQTQSDEEYAVALANLEKALAKLRVKRRHRSRI